MPPPSATSADLSANQREKRAQILEAAKVVLLRDGPSGCTSRAVANEMGLNKALLHYYFAAWDEVVDTAMSDLLSGMVDRIRTAAEAHRAGGAAESFDAMVDEYFAVFSERPGLSLLWFDYWIGAMRAGRGHLMVQVADDLISLLEELMAEAGFASPGLRARILFSYVIGALVRAELDGNSFEQMRPEIAQLSVWETSP